MVKLIALAYKDCPLSPNCMTSHTIVSLIAYMSTCIRYVHVGIMKKNIILKIGGHSHSLEIVMQKENILIFTNFLSNTLTKRRSYFSH